MNTQALVRGGVLDVCIGVPDLVQAIAYWELFGFRVGQTGALDAEQADALYGVDSACQMARLFHQQADHGLIRLMQWQQPTGSGLGLSSFKANGSRWSAAWVEQVARPFTHAKYAREQGRAIRIHPPDFMPQGPRPSAGFRHCIPGAFEMAIAQPYYRQVLFERADVVNPYYGRLNTGCMMKASQFTHCCVVCKGVDGDAFAFYDTVLGLRRSGDFTLSYQEIGTSGKDILELSEGEGFRLIKFDDPRSGDGDLKRSGRFTLFSFSDDVAMPDLRDAARPGALGHTLYSLRLNGIERAHTHLSSVGATGLTDIVRNEFNEQTFLATAPDGIRWMFIDADDSLPLGD